MALFRLLLGIAMLTMGRRLFWLFLGALGFLFGFDLAARMIHGQPQSVAFVLALLGGVIGAALAVFLQGLAIAVAGFFAGGYLFTGLLHEFGIGTSHYYWLLFFLGGLLGGVLMVLLFGWTLIILSSAMGSLLIIQALHFGPQTARPLFTLLLIAGIVIQYGLLGRALPPNRTRSR